MNQQTIMGKPTPPITRSRKEYAAPKINRQTNKGKLTPSPAHARKKYAAPKMNRQTVMGKPTPPITRSRKEYVTPKINRQTNKGKLTPSPAHARKKYAAPKMNRQTVMEKPTPPITRSRKEYVTPKINRQTNKGKLTPSPDHARMKYAAPKMNRQTVMKKPTQPITRSRKEYVTPKINRQIIMGFSIPPVTRARKEYVTPKMKQQTIMGKVTPRTAGARKEYVTPKMNRRRLRPRPLQIERSQNDSLVAAASTRKRPAEQLEKCGNNKRAKTDTSHETKEKVRKVQQKSVKPHKTDKEETETREHSVVNADNENNLEEAQSDNDWCKHCGQLLSDPDLRFFQGNPQDALDEQVALAKLKHNVCDGPNDETQYDLTDFTIFDKAGHMCSLDGNLIELGIELYVSGYILVTSKQLMEAVPVKEIGPITEWWITEYSRTEKSHVMIRTEIAEYRVGNLNVYYAPMMMSINEKIWIRKVMIEYIESKKHLSPTELSYTELLRTMEEKKVPETNTAVNEEMLHRHAYFLCEAASGVNYQNKNFKLLSLACLRDLVKYSGIKLFKGCQIGNNFRTVHKHKAPKRISAKDNVQIVLDKQDEELEKAAPWSRATTTPIVRQYFKSLFCNELDKTGEEAEKNKRCGICEVCQLPDCGKCSSCEDMGRIGDSGKKCKGRVCHGPMANVERMNNEDLENTHADQNDKIIFKERAQKNIEWIGNLIKEKKYAYYEQVKINDILYNRGDFVAIKPFQNGVPTLIGRIMFIYKDTKHPKYSYIHAQLFMRSSDTALGETGNRRELFLVDRCYNTISLSSVLWKVVVENKSGPTGSSKGQKGLTNKHVKDDGKHFFYSKFYNMYNVRFEDLPVDPVTNDRRKHRSCPSCDRKTAREFFEIPMVLDQLCDNVINLENVQMTQWASVKCHGRVYNKHCAVFLQPFQFKMPDSLRKRSQYTQTTRKNVDEDIYPEFYRKNGRGPLNFNLTARRTFTIGYIEAIIAHGCSELVSPQDIFLRIRVMYRPENTACRTPQNENWNEVYWTEDIAEVPFKYVVGPCHLYFEGNIPDKESPKEWLEQDPNRFFFNRAYDHLKCKFAKLPNEALSVGKSYSGKGKGTGKAKKTIINYVDEPKVQRLRTMDLFAGCGGLSEGLHQAGIADCKWAIENNEEAANAYSLNNRNCAVLTEDCNDVLKDVLAGAEYSARGKPLPKKGEVDLICGGPPCQGFSGMNRFHTGQYSTFQNSLVATFLSYCEHYRPKYVIMENVRNFATFKKGMMVKLTLRSLLAMEYQCTVAVLQAGSYGIPQTRRRIIILAAAPGCKLPLYPQPVHVFNRIGCRLSMKIDNKVYTSNIRTFRSAPRRACTIYDAMSDLPNISNGESTLEMDYATNPLTHFQRMVRSKDENAPLTDHICKKMSALALARIERIPMEPGSDWRDLPNIEVTLSDGSKTKKLQYLYHDKVQGPSKSGKRRGVCKCASKVNKQNCDPKYKQDHTLIPWGMAHTANNNNNWSGIYGRLSWYNYFRTTVTDPEPSAKQGRVLHPDQHRVVSVRECARSQGFRDSYLFSGSIQDKHCQIGNAVPPPLAAAIGRELKKALSHQN